jgi:hypothetical protein
MHGSTAANVLYRNAVNYRNLRKHVLITYIGNASNEHELQNAIRFDLADIKYNSNEINSRCNPIVYGETACNHASDMPALCKSKW